MGRLRVGVVYGGRSSEHEVSLASAAAIFGQIDRDRYDPIPLFIDKSGRWHVADSPPSTESAGAVIARSREAGTLSAAGTEAHLVAHPALNPLLTIARDAPRAVEAPDADRATVAELALDVVFPIVHGPFGEDGTLQGLLELANVPYVGAGVLGSAVAMDKAVAKVLLRAHGLPVVPGCVVGGVEWETDPDGVIERIEATFDYPLFVKPANLGSSVGVSRAADAEGLRSALAVAWTFDDKLVVEVAVPAAREIECSVLGNEAPEASVPGEVIPSGDFYDYEAKYLDDRSEIVIPAPLSTARTAQVRGLAIDAYRALDCAGMARVDFLLDEASDRLYVNEANTLPGFTAISQYAKLWAASGLPYPALIDRLIGYALARHRRRQRLRSS
ncbi:MAG: D-alanine--D-alanine ligase, partial [Acidobacteria bacterium]|nr:D-alanine--D-alanine ligase [Acidobacteriota bacterium]